MSLQLGNGEGDDFDFTVIRQDELWQLGQRNEDEPNAE